MKIKFIILLSLCFIILFAHTVSAEDMAWKEYLRDFLINNFPSLFDEATIAKNEELFKKWRENPDFKPNPADIPVDSISEWMPNNAYYPLLLPWNYKFYDLDDDGIPEVIISYPTIWAEGLPQSVYKLNGMRYEKIYNAGTTLSFCKNSQGKLVVLESFYTALIAIYFGEIKNGELIFNDYVDSEGNVTYKNEEYKDFGLSDFLNSDIANGLTPLPEFDCPEVVDAAKQSVYSPKTGDNCLIFIILIAACLAAVKIKKEKYYKG